MAKLTNRTLQQLVPDSDGRDSFAWDGFHNSFSNDGWCTTSSGITDPSQGAGNIPNDPGITSFSC